MISMVNQWLPNDLGHSGGKELFRVFILCSCVLNIDSDHLFGLKEGIFYIALISLLSNERGFSAF